MKPDNHLLDNNVNAMVFYPRYRSMQIGRWYKEMG